MVSTLNMSMKPTPRKRPQTAMVKRGPYLSLNRPSNMALVPAISRPMDMVLATKERGQANSAINGLKKTPRLLKMPHPTACSKKHTPTMMKP